MRRAAGCFPQFSDGETPTGTVNGLNTTFTLAFTPSPVSSVQLYLTVCDGSGIGLHHQRLDQITFATGFGAANRTICCWRVTGTPIPSNPLGSLTTPQVVCSAVGMSTSSASSTSLGSCTLPAGLLSSGDRIEVQYLFSHTGTTTGFTPQVSFGGTPVFRGRHPRRIRLSRGRWISPLIRPRSRGAGRTGVVRSFRAGLGSTEREHGAQRDHRFQGQMSASTSDTVGLSGFTVVRYPGASKSLAEL